MVKQMNIILDAPPEILVSIVEFVPKNERFLLREVNTRLRLIFEHYFLKTSFSVKRWKIALKGQSLWEHCKNYQDHQSHPFEIELCKLLFQHRLLRFTKDCLTLYKPPTLPLHQKVIQNFISNGRVDLLDHYIENDSHLSLTFHQRMNRLPFHFIEYQNKSWNLVAFDFIFHNKSKDVLLWFQKHIDIFCSPILIPSLGDPFVEKLKSIVQKVERFSPFAVYWIDLQTLKNLAEIIGTETTKCLLHCLDIDACCFTFDNIKDLSLIGTFKIHFESIIDSISDLWETSLKTFHINQIQSQLHLIETEIGKLKKGDDYLSSWHLLKSENYLQFVINQGWLEGTKYIERLDIDLSMMVRCKLSLKPLNATMMDWMIDVYLENFVGNWGFLNLCLCCLFKMPSDSVFYRKSLERLAINDQTGYVDKHDLNLLSCDGFLWIEENFPRLYRTVNHRIGEYDSFLQGQPREIRRLYLQAKMADNIFIGLYHLSTEMSHLNLIEHLLEQPSLENQKQVLKPKNFQWSIIHPIKIRFLFKLFPQEKDFILSKIGNLECYKTFRHLSEGVFNLKDCVLNDFDLHESFTHFDLLIEMKKDGIIFSDSLIARIVDHIVSQGCFQYLPHFLKQESFHLFHPKMMIQYHKNFIELVCNWYKSTQNQSASLSNSEITSSTE
jgi:hypothetical protein